MLPEVSLNAVFSMLEYWTNFSRQPQQYRRTAHLKQVFLAYAMNDGFQPPSFSQPSKQIRLLKILSGDGDSNVECKIRGFDLDQAPAYEAISYAWGSSERVRPIRITARMVSVGQNCYYAL